MIPTAIGQIVKFHTTCDGENPDQKYVVLEVHNDVQNPRARIMPLNTGLAFPPISVVAAGELEVIAVSTGDLLGAANFIRKEDGSVLLGEIVSVEQKEVVTSLFVTDWGVETNVRVTIADGEGESQSGNLLVR